MCTKMLRGIKLQRRLYARRQMLPCEMLQQRIVRAHFEYESTNHGPCQYGSG